MNYCSVAEAMQLPGLRLVLTAGMPGPWGLAAKAVLEFKSLDYVAVAQEAGGENSELAQWTGQTAAPVLVHDQRFPATTWESILFLAEELAPDPELIPSDVGLRVQMFGLCREIAGQHGFGWLRRLGIFHQSLQQEGLAGSAVMQRLIFRYGYSEQSLAAARPRLAAIMNALAERLHARRREGSTYLVGSALSAADLYWANFAALIEPLPQQDNPMPPGLRELYTLDDPRLLQVLDPILLEHRDFIYREHLRLPLDY